MAGKIIVIDDEVSIDELIKLALQSKGYQVEYSTTGNDGVELFGRFMPDLALVDYTLPDIDGIEVARKIKQTDHGKKTPLLLMTGRSVSESDMDRSLFAGVLEKPVSMARLAAVIGEMLQTISR